MRERAWPVTRLTANQISAAQTSEIAPTSAPAPTTITQRVVSSLTIPRPPLGKLLRYPFSSAEPSPSQTQNSVAMVIEAYSVTGARYPGFTFHK